MICLAVRYIWQKGKIAGFIFIAGSMIGFISPYFIFKMSVVLFNSGLLEDAETVKTFLSLFGATMLLLGPIVSPFILVLCHD